MPVEIMKKNRDAIPGYNPKRHAHKVPLVKVSRKGTTYQIDGVVMELFTISVFAEALDRTASTIRELQGAGKLLPPLFHVKMKNGRGNLRLYSASQVTNANRLLFLGKFKGAKFSRNSGDGDFFDALKSVFYEKDVVVNDEGTITREREE